MPLNEKAALGGAAFLETSSQGSLDNPPYKPAALRPCGAGDRRAVYTFPRRFRTPRHGRSYPPLERALDRLWRAMQARSRR